MDKGKGAQRVIQNYCNDKHLQAQTQAPSISGVPARGHIRPHFTLQREHVMKIGRKLKPKNMDCII